MKVGERILVNKRNGLSWHRDSLFKHLSKSNEGALEMSSKQELEMFSNIENNKWKCFPVLIRYIFQI